MTETSLPALTAASNTAAKLLGRSSSKDAKQPREDDQTQAINAMCKTLNATVTKLLYSFAALNSESDAASGSATSTLALALAASKRDELSIKIADALASSVERVIKCKDTALRSMALKEVRARFVVHEKPKAEMCDQGVQAAPRRPKVSLADAAKAMMNHSDSPTQVAFMGSFRKSPAASKKVEAAPTDEEILRQLAAGTSSTDENVDTTNDDAKSGDGGKRSRPASATDPSSSSGGTKLPGIYERQLQWAKKASERREQMKIDKENREREAEKPADGSKKSNRWAHVESVMKRERITAEEGWKQDMQAEMNEERELRREAERKAREQAERAKQLQAERDKAEAARKEAVQKMDVAHKKMVATEKKYESAKMAQEKLAQQHKDELEIRDAFGEKGLEQWPMFPGKKLFRVLESEEFDGRVSQEFRQKDPESGERGVTLLMGRLAHAKQSEAQAVLFDERFFSDLQAARWWQTNGHRFELVKERIARDKQRAQSAQGLRRPVRESTLSDEVLEKFPGLKKNQNL